MSESHYSHRSIHNTTRTTFTSRPSGFVLTASTKVTTTKSIVTHSTLSFITPTAQPTFFTNSTPHESGPPTTQAPDTLSFVAPLLGAIAGLGLLAFIALYCIQQMNKPKLLPRQRSESKWGSLGSLEESMPPPVYTPVAIPTPIKEKRLTSDTLVDSSPQSMLKSQYSPQLALSPSLVAGDFKRDSAPPPPLPSNVISPSNTLIDSCVLSIDKNRKFDTYEPQLLRDEEDDPDSYKNQKKQ